MIRLTLDRDGAWIGVAAALSLLATLAIGIGAMLHAESARIAAQARVVTVAIAAVDPVQQSDRAQGLLAMLRRRGDLADVHLVDPATVRADTGIVDDAPVPALIDATVKQGRSSDDVKRAIAGLPGVSLTDDGAGFDDLAGAIRAVAHAAHAVAILTLSFGLVVGAVRGSQERALVGTLARLGATARQAALAVGMLSGRAALIGGTAGLLPGVIALPFIAAQAAGIDKSGMAGIGIDGALTIVATPVLLALVAAGAGGTAAVLRFRRLR